MDTVLHNKDITEPSKDNCAHRKPLSTIQGYEVQEDGMLLHMNKKHHLKIICLLEVHSMYHVIPIP